LILQLPPSNELQQDFVSIRLISLHMAMMVYQ